MDLICVLLWLFLGLEENTKNNEINTDEEVSIYQMPEHVHLDNPALDYKKNLIRLLILSGIGVVSLILLGLSFFLIMIKI